MAAPAVLRPPTRSLVGLALREDHPEIARPHSGDVHEVGRATADAAARRARHDRIRRAARAFGAFVAERLVDTELTPATPATEEGDSEVSVLSPPEGVSTPPVGDVESTAGGSSPNAAGAAAREAQEAEAEPGTDSCDAAMPDGAFVAWRAAVDGLFADTASLSPEALDDLLELRHGREAVASRFEVSRKGGRPVLVTAPHCIYLRRDGHTPHLEEKFTREVGEALAEELGGSVLTWTKDEQRWSQRLVACGRQHGGDPGWLQDILDPRNRDPNYLRADEVWANPWFQAMQGVARDWRLAFGHGIQMLHVDVHGCQDPPTTPSHLTVGLGAMQECATRLSMDFSELAVFRDALHAELTAVLDRLGLAFENGAVVGAGTSNLVRVILDAKTCPDQHRARAFAGAWAAGSCRLTQTQQAMSCADFTHAVQLELSKALRIALLKGRDHAAIARLANGLQAAWVKAKQHARGFAAGAPEAGSKPALAGRALRGDS